MKGFGFNVSKSAVGFAARHKEDDYAVVVFRGTSKLWDWWINSKIKLVPERAGGRVHKGFQQALDTIWPQVEDTVRSLGVIPIFFTGHSLGGAMATIAASRCRWRPIQIYTFGAPRIGDDEFVHTLMGVPWFRMRGEFDIVSRLPPRWLGYADGGEDITHAGVGHSIHDMVKLTQDIGGLSS